MSYKIVNLATGQTAKNTNCTFEYRGYEVSMFNSGVCPSKVAVFSPDPEYFKEFDTVEQALDFIDEEVFNVESTNL